MSSKTPTKGGGGTSSKPSVSNPDLDIKLDKIKITPFSDGKDWESTLFELKLILKQVWKDPSIDICSFITDKRYAASLSPSPELSKANELIYYILSVGSTRGSFARDLIMAAQSKTAQPHIPENAGLELLQYFDAVFLSTDDHATRLPLAQKTFHTIQQTSKESANAYISRVDLAVSSLTKLKEPVSENTWIYALINGLRPEFEETRKGVLYGRPGYDSVVAIKDSIINEEAVINNAKGKKPNDNPKDKSSDTAFTVNDHKDKTCHYCNKKGHIQPDCRKKKADLENGNNQTKGKGKSKGKGKGKSYYKGQNSNPSSGKGKNTSSLRRTC
jgi:hypothetical protein